MKGAKQVHQVKRDGKLSERGKMFGGISPGDMSRGKCPDPDMVPALYRAPRSTKQSINYLNTVRSSPRDCSARSRRCWMRIDRY